MSKTKAEDVKKIGISFLKKHNYFTGWKSGNITWTSGFGGNKTSVGIEVQTSLNFNDGNYCRIYYTQTDNYTGEKKDFNYRIPLVTTPCNYGGVRHWFVCPWYKNKIYCGRRVGALYKDGDYFACRHCYEITYESRNMGGFEKAIGVTMSYDDLDKLWAETKRTHYNGKMTKKYKKYLYESDKLENAFLVMASRLGK